MLVLVLNDWVTLTKLAFFRKPSRIPQALRTPLLAHADRSFLVYMEVREEAFHP